MVMLGDIGQEGHDVNISQFNIYSYLNLKPLKTELQSFVVH